MERIINIMFRFYFVWRCIRLPVQLFIESCQDEWIYQCWNWFRKNTEFDMEMKCRSDYVENL